MTTTNEIRTMTRVTFFQPFYSHSSSEWGTLSDDMLFDTTDMTIPGQLVKIASKSMRHGDAMKVGDDYYGMSEDGVVKITQGIYFAWRSLCFVERKFLLDDILKCEATDA